MATDFTLPKTPVAPKVGKIMDLTPSKGLATGLKRTGGRRGITRLSNNTPKRGRLMILHKY